MLIGGSAGAQLLTLAVSPILTRLYDPHDFGTLAVFTAMLVCVSVLACLRYELAIALPASDAEAENVVALSVVCLTVTSLLCTLVILCFGDEIADVLNWEHASGYIWLLPVGIFAAGIFAVTEKWMVRSHHFSRLAKTKLLQSATSNGIQLGGYSFGVLSLIAGAIVGQSLGAGQYIVREIRQRGGGVSWAGIAAVASRYRNFPLFSTWGVMFNVAGVQLVPLVFSALFGTIVVGYFAFALRLVQGPTTLIGAALCNVFIAHAPAALREGRLAAVVEEMRRKLAVVGIPALVLLTVSGPDLFAAVFGEKWRQAGVYARWMAPWIYLQFQVSPISPLAQILEAQKMELAANFITFSMRAVTLAVCYVWSVPGNTSVQAFCVVSAVAYLAMLTLFMSRVGVGLPAMLMHDIRKILLFLLCAAPALYLFDGSVDVRTGLAACYFMILSAGWLYRERRTGTW
ncbi:hypothetical protein LMG26411_02128 [Cupriavidus numazuensis]|uniref:Uncharacterized protein n=2 Tax=Cupriavidus numazuensis TaxID=221992 RepID=A0ABM8TFR2_9BURK|nr:hypothetical protein LMG26411_02128 [Cupriavidus numazuensis]